MTDLLPHRSIGRKMSKTCRVALLGFSEFERVTLANYFRLSRRGEAGYEFVPAGCDCELLVADADHAPSVRLVMVTDRVAETVFIGSRPPAGAVAWTMRPIDPMQVARELDALRLQAAPARPLAPPPAPPPATAPQHTALLVDDSTIALRFLQARLRPWGLAVDCVGRSGLALERLAQRHYDFVFVDVELGADSELDGLALCQHLRRHQPLPVSTLVMVSAHQSELDRVRGMLAGCDAYLGKPLQTAELEVLLSRQGLKRSAVADGTPLADAPPGTGG